MKERDKGYQKKFWNSKKGLAAKERMKDPKVVEEQKAARRQRKKNPRSEEAKQRRKERDREKRAAASEEELQRQKEGRKAYRESERGIAANQRSKDKLKALAKDPKVAASQRQNRREARHKFWSTPKGMASREAQNERARQWKEQKALKAKGLTAPKELAGAQQAPTPPPEPSARKALKRPASALSPNTPASPLSHPASKPLPLDLIDPRLRPSSPPPIPSGPSADAPINDWYHYLAPLKEPAGTVNPSNLMVHKRPRLG